MYDFATAITPAVVAFINTMLGFVDPTTFVGGAITLTIVGTIGIGLVSGLLRLAMRRG